LERTESAETDQKRNVINLTSQKGKRLAVEDKVDRLQLGQRHEQKTRMAKREKQKQRSKSKADLDDADLRVNWRGSI
jgi:hypothetical protein